jgi:ribosomal-protein-serine acetyltransferase
VIGIRVDDEVFLRLHEVRHAEELFRLTDANRDHLGPWMPWIESTKSADDTRAYLREVQRNFAEGREYGFDIVERRELVGTIGLRVDAMAQEAEIGYWLAKTAEGRGIITRASEALVRFAFDELGLNRVLILCAADNARSRAVPERLGFTHEATLRQREVMPGREPRDQLQFALLRSDRNSSPKEP